MAKQKQNVLAFDNHHDLMVRAMHRGLGEMIAEQDAANAPAEEAPVKTGRRGRPPGTGAKRGRPPGTGAKRGPKPGAKRGPKPGVKKTPAKKAATGKRRGRPSNAELAARAAKEAAAAKRAKTRKANAKAKAPRKAKVIPLATAA